MAKEEIYGILSQEEVLVHEGGVALQQGQSEEPPLQFRGYSDGDVLIRIQKRDQDPIDLTAEDLLNPGEATSSGTNVAAFPAAIVAKLDATTYRVRDLTSNTAYVARCVPTLPDDEELEADTEVLVIATESATYFQVPTWL